eukprot:m.113021 g.113021  ORF g.113021 m.113021 type:complete len:244 (-) comp13499_c0_seq2:1471-2202(-)
MVTDSKRWLVGGLVLSVCWITFLIVTHNQHTDSGVFDAHGNKYDGSSAFHIKDKAELDIEQQQHVADLVRRPHRDAVAFEQSLGLHDSIYDLRVRQYTQHMFDMSSLKGKVVLIVNTALHDTKSQKELSELNQVYDQFRNKPFEILAVPCNQFGGEPGSPAEVARRMKLNFHVEFPILEMMDVNGERAHPLFRLLKERYPGAIQGNFAGKFLIDAKGRVVKRAKGSSLLFVKDISSALADIQY